jgi:hypothetical protein
MIRNVRKPLVDVAKAVLAYVDPEGMRKFTLICINPNPENEMFAHPSLDDPASFEGHTEYIVVHHYHSERCVINNPTDPRFLNASANIANLTGNPIDELKETEIRWQLDHMRDETQKPGYDALESVLRECMPAEVALIWRVE